MKACIEQKSSIKVRDAICIEIGTQLMIKLRDCGIKLVTIRALIFRSIDFGTINGSLKRMVTIEIVAMRTHILIENSIALSGCTKLK